MHVVNFLSDFALERHVKRLSAEVIILEGFREVTGSYRAVISSTLDAVNSETEGKRAGQLAPVIVERPTGFVAEWKDEQCLVPLGVITVVIGWGDRLAGPWIDDTRENRCDEMADGILLAGR